MGYYRTLCRGGTIIMKICVRGGHNTQATGANNLIDEVTEDRIFKDYLIKYLKAGGADVVDATPGPCDLYADLEYGVNVANGYGADLYIPCHFNNAYNDVYHGGIGTEVCVYNTNDTAQRIVNAIASFGFKNRGQKVRPELYDLRKTSMRAIIIELCFVEATADVELYKIVGAEAIAKKVAEAILDTSSIAIPSEPVISPEPSVVKNDWVARLQSECNAQGFSNQAVDGIPGPNTLAGCPMLRYGATGNITKLLQQRLTCLGYDTNGVDGVFGNGTKNAVMNLQSYYGLSVDGIVGNATWGALLDL